MRETSAMACSSLAQTVVGPGRYGTARRSSMGNPRSRQFSKPLDRGTRHAQPPKLERRPGARRIVRSRAVQNDLAVTWQLALSPLDVLGRDPKRARDRVGHGLRVELLFQLVRRDPGDSEKAEKAAPPSVLDEDVLPETGAALARGHTFSHRGCTTSCVTTPTNAAPAVTSTCF